MFMFPVLTRVKYSYLEGQLKLTSHCLRRTGGDDLASRQFQINKIRHKKLTSFFFAGSPNNNDDDDTT